MKMHNFLMVLRKEGPKECQKCECYLASFENNAWKFKCESQGGCYKTQIEKATP